MLIFKPMSEKQIALKSFQYRSPTSTDIYPYLIIPFKNIKSLNSQTKAFKKVNCEIPEGECRNTGK
ncbi:MAG: hypothetical protein D6734_02265 [Candidatus Schekmanbacteria bacterium]|nr:MAG: hypothetical protein D6734_02265 [Candidatus Schekmanbacteria bacterium]